MRTAFVETLIELARLDPRIFLLTADMGWSILEPFIESFPDRFLNVGVAEQNLAGVATGLAQVGYVPFIYSIANFVSMRCYEQIRNGPVLHRLPVRVIGVGGGFAYGHAGPTHHALEDLPLFRAQPGMTVIAPADPAQTRSVLRSTLGMAGPVYLRIGKDNNPEIPGLNGRFALGCPELVRHGTDVLYLATGAIAAEAVEAAELLERKGIQAAAAVLAHLPFTSSKELAKLLARFSQVVTVEEGFPVGGLGSLAADTIACRGLHCRLSIRGARELGGAVCGSPAYMRRRTGLTAAELAEDFDRNEHDAPASDFRAHSVTHSDPRHDFLAREKA